MLATETWGPSTLTIAGVAPAPNSLTLTPSMVAPGQTYVASGSAGPLADGTTVPDGTTLYVYVDGVQVLVQTNAISGGAFSLSITDPPNDTATSHSVVVSTSPTPPTTSVPVAAVTPAPATQVATSRPVSASERARGIVSIDASGKGRNSAGNVVA